MLWMAAGSFGQLSYTIADNKVTITECATNAEGFLEIPATIEGYPVTAIGWYSFFDCRRLTGVSIPDTVTNLEEGAFWDCRNLARADIPSNVTTMGNFVFHFCYKLTNAVVPDGVTRLPAGVFASCINLTRVKLSTNVTWLGEGVFANCARLPSVVIPASVSSFGHEVFVDCARLTNVLFRGDAPTEYGDLFSDGLFSNSTPNIYYPAGAGGWGDTYSGRPAAAWEIAAMPEPSNGLAFTAAAFEGETYVVEALTDPASGPWTPIRTNVFSAGAVQVFNDEEWTNHPARFYRVVMP